MGKWNTKEGENGGERKREHNCILSSPTFFPLTSLTSRTKIIQEMIEVKLIVTEEDSRGG